MADILQTQTQNRMLGQMPSLPLTQGLFTKSSTKPEYVTAEQMAPAMEETRKARSGLMQDMDAAAAEQQRLEQKRTVEREEQKLQLRQEEAKMAQESPERQALKLARDELKNAAFVPSKDNAKDMATMFSLIGIVGMAVGGEGKLSAYNTMGAMNGMLEGYQKGRADIYKREKDIFEKNIKVLQNKVTILQSELQEALQTYRTNRELGEQQAEIAFAKAGSKIGDAILKQRGIQRAVEYIDGVSKDTSSLVALRNNQVKRAEDMAFKERQLEQQKLDRQEARNLRLAQTTKPQYQLIEQDGKVVAIDLRNPTAPPVETGIQAGAKKFGSAGQGGAANNRYAFNIHESGMQATNDLLNITSLPANTVLGTFAGMTGQSGNTLISSLKNTFARKITPDDQRLMQQMISGLEYNMARALGGGYANSSAKAVLDIYKQQVAQQGDSAAAQAMFLARMKQELKVLFKAFKNHPGSNSGYVADFQQASNLLDKNIPFEVNDVSNAIRGSKQTFVEKYVPTMEGSPRFVLPTAETQTFGAKSFATEEEAQAAFKAGSLKSGEKVIINGIRGTWE